MGFMELHVYINSRHILLTVSSSRLFIAPDEQVPLSLIYFFADDLLLFVEASESQIDVIMECLNNFYSALGQKISPQKSSIAFSRNVQEVVAKRISDTAKIPITEKLKKYFGVPSLTDRIHAGSFQHVRVSNYVLLGPT